MLSHIYIYIYIHSTKIYETYFKIILIKKYKNNDLNLLWLNNWKIKLTRWNQRWGEEEDIREKTHDQKPGWMPHGDIRLNMSHSHVGTDFGYKNTTTRWFSLSALICSRFPSFIVSHLLTPPIPSQVHKLRWTFHFHKTKQC